MAEKIPKVHTEKVKTKEKPTGDATSTILTSDDKMETFEGAGYGSASGSSDVMLGAESSVRTSDDHGFEEARMQQESSTTELAAASEVTSSGLDIASKPVDVVKKPSKKPNLGFFKNVSPVAKHVASTSELTENLISYEEEDKTRISPRKTGTRSKFSSGLHKLVSFRKTSTSKYQSCSPAKQEGDDKTLPKKSARKLSFGIPTSFTPKKQRLVVSLPDEEHGLNIEKEDEKSSRSPRGMSPIKDKSSKQASSVQSKHVEVASHAGECSVKPKRASKFAFGKIKTTKQVATVETPLARQSPLPDVKSEAPSATSSAFALVRKGIKKMDVLGKLRISRKRDKETRLIEDESTKTESTQGEEISSEDRSLNEPYVFLKSSWKPGNPTQEGGHLAEDMIAYVSSSEKDTTPTDLTTLSDSSSLIRSKSKSQRSRHRTLDSMSKVSSFEEEIEGAAGIEGGASPQLQRQTNIPDTEVEEDSGDVFDISIERVNTPEKKSDDETDE